MYSILPHRHLLYTCRQMWWAIFIFLLAIPGYAENRFDIHLSGFGTAGFAISDQDFIYQRFIDDGGTLQRDSVIGIQLDAQFNDTWGLTLQTKGAASGHDEGWEPTLSWAFLSWRPSNDWLLRAGKLRLPLMHYSANSDVGMTFDFARLPIEVYSLMPTTDVTGLAFSKTWFNQQQELTLESYLGQAHTDWRYFIRENSPPFTTGPMYIGVDLDMIGLSLSLHNANENTWHIGLHRANLNSDYGDLPSDYPFVQIMPGVGYYQMDSNFPGPGVPTASELHIYVFTIGAEINLPYDSQLIAEYGRRRITNATMGPDTSAAYLALKKTIGHWTSYLYWSGIRTDGPVLDLYVAIENNRVPDFIPEAAMINASQRIGADLLGAFDQHSWAIGASYTLSPTSKLKAEWLYTRTGEVSSFIDSQDSRGQDIHVFSLSYSFLF
ncbi:outer membrane protein [Thiospirillum jenense]|uniref:Porin n=1 Tax=Thiospirillum jenense TaxID=1653858 RepID=A0A839HDF4_9GAMM|nr:hypothetical protein [Thiospirillum jenense]MBB1125217.1 hypothetical protein [Thiospirillum jenense]